MVRLRSPESCSYQALPTPEAEEDRSGQDGLETGGVSGNKEHTHTRPFFSLISGDKVREPGKFSPQPGASGPTWDMTGPLS